MVGVTIEQDPFYLSATREYQVVRYNRQGSEGQVPRTWSWRATASAEQIRFYIIHWPENWRETERLLNII